jgi:DNA-binding transcriptional MerR regulator
MVTITRFAERTGIAPSALRFYDRKALLVPAHRLNNGYRAYATEQVASACFINSLREADVPIAQIRAFLRESSAARAPLVAAWQQELAARELSIKLAQNCLRGYGDEQPPLQILRWREPSYMVWIPVSAPPGPRPFADLVARERRRFQRGGALVIEAGYVRTRALRGDAVHGELGFRLRSRGRVPTVGRAEEIDASLFVTVECRSDDEEASSRVFRTLAALGFAPAGLSFERYLLDTSDRSLLLISAMSQATTAPLP